MITVERLRPDEAVALRAIRLAALADAPDAFGSTYDAEARYDDSEWERRASVASAGPEAAVFFARNEHDDVAGLVGVFENLQDASTAELVSMWVAPSGRGSGVGATLVERAITWAQESGFARIELWVARGNDTAERLYLRSGFTVTGDVQPLPSDPCKDEIRMRLDL